MSDARNSAIEIIKLAANVYIGFIHTPGGIHRSCEAIPSLLEIRHVARHPTMNRCVRHDNAALGPHRHEIPIAQTVRDVPAYAKFDDLGIERRRLKMGSRTIALVIRRLADAGIARYRPLVTWASLEAGNYAISPLMQLSHRK